MSQPVITLFNISLLIRSEITAGVAREAMTRLIGAGGACDYWWRGGGFESLNVSPIRLSGLRTNYCLLVKTVAYALGCFNTQLLFFCINRDF